MDKLKRERLEFSAGNVWPQLDLIASIPRVTNHSNGVYIFRVIQWMTKASWFFIHYVLSCARVRSMNYDELCRYIAFTSAAWFECLNTDVHTWSRDLAKVRHTHVRDNTHYLQASYMRIWHGKNYFLVSHGKAMPSTHRNVLYKLEWR